MLQTSRLPATPTKQQQQQHISRWIQGSFSTGTAAASATKRKQSSLESMIGVGVR
jgi:hypothetical protein